jgi:hypothetical protein
MAKKRENGQTGVSGCAKGAGCGGPLQLRCSQHFKLRRRRLQHAIFLVITTSTCGCFSKLKRQTVRYPPLVRPLFPTTLLYDHIIHSTPPTFYHIQLRTDANLEVRKTSAPVPYSSKELLFLQQIIFSLSRAKDFSFYIVG